MLKDIKNIIIIVLVITNILVYFLGNRDKELLVAKVTEVYKLQIVEISSVYKLSLERDKEIIDTLISKLDRKITYQINTDLTKTKAKKNSTISLDLNSKINTETKETIVEPKSEVNTNDNKRNTWFNRVFRRNRNDK
jgi:hypothetical protein